MLFPQEKKKQKKQKKKSAFEMLRHEKKQGEVWSALSCQERRREYCVWETGFLVCADVLKFFSLMGQKNLST